MARTVAAVESYDGLTHVFGPLDQQLATLETFRQEPANREVAAMLQSAFRCAAAGSGSISGLVDAHGFSRFCFYSGLCVSRTLSLELDAAAVGGHKISSEQQQHDGVGEGGRSRSNSITSAASSAGAGPAAASAQVSAPQPAAVGAAADAACPDFGFSFEHSITWHPSLPSSSGGSGGGEQSQLAEEEQLAQSRSARYTAKRIPEHISLSVATGKRIFAFLSSTFRATTSSAPVLRFTGFCLALVHIAHILYAFTYGAASSPTADDHTHSTVAQPIPTLLRSLFALKKLDGFLKRFCVIVPYPADVMKHSSFLATELWRWCPALDSVFVYYCTSTKVNAFIIERPAEKKGGATGAAASREEAVFASLNGGLSLEELEEKAEREQARDILSRGRFLRFSIDLGMGSGFDLVAAERIFDELASDVTIRVPKYVPAHGEAGREQTEEERRLEGEEKRADDIKKLSQRRPVVGARTIQAARKPGSQVSSQQQQGGITVIAPTVMKADYGLKRKLIVQKNERKFMTFSAFCDAIVKIACITGANSEEERQQRELKASAVAPTKEQKAAAVSSSTTFTRRAAASASAAGATNNNSGGDGPPGAAAAVPSITTVPDAVEKFLLAVLGPLFQAATSGADILAARSLVPVPQATVTPHSMQPAVLHAAEPHGASRKSSRLHNQGTIFIEGKNIGALGLGVWVYCSASSVPIHHISAESMQHQQHHHHQQRLIQKHQQHQQVQRSGPLAAASASAANSVVDDYTTLEFKLATGESPDIVWATAQVNLTAKTTDYLDVSVVFSTPVFVAVGNTPEQLLFDSEPVHVGTLLLELKPAMVPAKIIELAEAHFTVGCTRTSGLNKHQLYEDGWKYLCSKLLMGPGKHHRNCLGCGPAAVVNTLDRQGVLDAIFRSRASRAASETSGRPFMRFAAFLDSLLRLVISHGCAVDAIPEVLREQLQLRGSGGPDGKDQPLLADDGQHHQLHAPHHLSSPGRHLSSEEQKRINSLLHDAQKATQQQQQQTPLTRAESIAMAKATAAAGRPGADRTGSSYQQSESDRAWTKKLVDSVTHHKAQQDALRHQLVDSKAENELLAEKLKEARDATASLSMLAEEFFSVSDLAFEQVMRHVPDPAVKRLVQAFRNTVQQATDKHHDLLSNVQVKLKERKKELFVDGVPVSVIQEREQQKEHSQHDSSEMLDPQQRDVSSGSIRRKSTSLTPQTPVSIKTSPPPMLQASLTDMMDAMRDMARSQEKEREEAALVALKQRQLEQQQLLQQQRQAAAAAAAASSTPAAATPTNPTTSTGAAGGNSSDAAASSKTAAGTGTGGAAANNSNNNSNSEESTATSNSRRTGAAAAQDQQRQRLKENALLESFKEEELKALRGKMMVLRKEVTMKEQQFALEKQRLENEKHELKEQLRRLTERLKTTQEMTTMMVLRSNEAVEEAKDVSNKLRTMSMHSMTMTAESRTSSGSHLTTRRSSPAPQQRSTTQGQQAEKQQQPQQQQPQSANGNRSRSRKGGFGATTPRVSIISGGPPAASSAAADTTARSGGSPPPRPSSASSPTRAAAQGTESHRSSVVAREMNTPQRSAAGRESPVASARHGETRPAAAVSGAARVSTPSTPAFASTAAASARAAADSAAPLPGAATSPNGTASSAPSYYPWTSISVEVAGAKEHIARLRTTQERLLHGAATPAEGERDLHAFGESSSNPDGHFDVFDSGALPASVVDLLKCNTRLPPPLSRPASKNNSVTLRVGDSPETPPVVGTAVASPKDGHSIHGRPFVPGAAAPRRIWHLLRNCRLGLVSVRETIAVELGRTAEWMRSAAATAGAKLPEQPLKSSCATQTDLSSSEIALMAAQAASLRDIHLQQKQHEDTAASSPPRHIADFRSPSSTAAGAAGTFPNSMQVRGAGGRFGGSLAHGFTAQHQQQQSNQQQQLGGLLVAGRGSQSPRGGAGSMQQQQQYAMRATSGDQKPVGFSRGFVIAPPVRQDRPNTSSGTTKAPRATNDYATGTSPHAPTIHHRRGLPKEAERDDGDGVFVDSSLLTEAERLQLRMDDDGTLSTAADGEYGQQQRQQPHVGRRLQSGSKVLATGSAHTHNGAPERQPLGGADHATRQRRHVLSAGGVISDAQRARTADVNGMAVGDAGNGRRAAGGTHGGVVRSALPVPIGGPLNYQPPQPTHLKQQAGGSHELVDDDGFGATVGLAPALHTSHRPAREPTEPPIGGARIALSPVEQLIAKSVVRPPNHGLPPPSVFGRAETTANNGTVVVHRRPSTTSATTATTASAPPPQHKIPMPSRMSQLQ